MDRSFFILAPEGTKNSHISSNEPDAAGWIQSLWGRRCKDFGSAGTDGSCEHGMDVRCSCAKSRCCAMTYSVQYREVRPTSRDRCTILALLELTVSANTACLGDVNLKIAGATECKN